MLFFFDEARFGLIATLKRKWAKIGRPLKVEVSLSHEWFYIYSAVCPHTGEEVTYFLPLVNTDVMNIFLQELSQRYPDKKILLIMDRAPWHRAKKLNVYHNIEIEFLPAYSPELNPVERLWKWFRQECTHNRIFEGLEKMMDALQKTYLRLGPNKLATLCQCNYL